MTRRVKGAVWRRGLERWNRWIIRVWREIQRSHVYVLTWNDVRAAAEAIFIRGRLVGILIRLGVVIPDRHQIIGDLSGGIVSRLDRTVNGLGRLLIDAKLREKHVNNRHIKKCERD